MTLRMIMSLIRPWRNALPSRAAYGFWLAAAVLGLLLASPGCSAPQLESEEGLRVADALFTAVTSQRTNLLEQASENLEQLHASGKVSSDCYVELHAVVEQAKSGEWKPAAKRLRKFIKAQRQP